jgi:tetratricopeptide (TPR) repeat protein
MEEALSLERSLGVWPLDNGPAGVFGHQLFWSGDVDRARTILQRVLSALKERNDPIEDAGARWYLSLIEWRAGNWDDASRYAAESLELTAQLGIRRLPDEYPAAIIAAHRGRSDEARAHAQEVVERAEADQGTVVPAGYSWVLGFVELSLGDADRALVHLRRAAAVRDEMGIGEPGMCLELGDLFESLVAVGELDEVEEALVKWEESATALGRAWALAILARCRGLLLAARGDLDGAFAYFERALAEHARSIDPFHNARTLLALGRTQRRAKKRAAARTTLETALAEFKRIGAPSGASRHGTSSGGSAAGRPRAATSPKPSNGSPDWSPRAARTATSPPRCSSPSTPSRPRSPASTASSASAPAQN